MPRIPSYKLNPIVRSNIARLQNDRQPTVKAANKRLQSVIRGLASIDASESPSRANPYASNVFRRAVQPDTSRNAPNIFAPLPQRLAISWAQYKQGIRSVHETFGAKAGQEDPNVIGATPSIAEEAEETEPVEASSTNTPPSQIVPLEDLNIGPEGLFDEVLDDVGSGSPPITIPVPAIVASSLTSLSSSSSNSSFNDLISESGLASLPENLFESDLDDCASELDIGLNTEDELLNSDRDEIARVPTTPHKQTEQEELGAEATEPLKLFVRLDRSRIDLRAIFDQPRSNSTIAELVTPAKPEANSRGADESPVHPPFDLSLPDAEDTETEDTGKPTPPKPREANYLIQLPKRTRNSRKLNKAMRAEATAAYTTYKRASGARANNPPGPNLRVARKLFGPGGREAHQGSAGPKGLRGGIFDRLGPA